MLKVKGKGGSEVFLRRRVTRGIVNVRNIKSMTPVLKLNTKRTSLNDFKTGGWRRTGGKVGFAEQESYASIEAPISAISRGRKDMKRGEGARTGRRLHPLRPLGRGKPRFLEQDD